MARRIRTLLLCLGACAALVLPAQALAANGVYNDYTKDGEINGCDYSAGQINAALASIPTDVAQYDPGFKDALNKALSDSCAQTFDGSRTDHAPGAAQGYDPDGSPGPNILGSGRVATDANLASSEEPLSDLSSDRGFPTALLVLAGMVAVILAGTGGLALARSGRAGNNRIAGTLSDYYWGLRDRVGR